MSDISVGNLIPAPTPPCPVCGGDTIMQTVHKAVAAVTDVFRCKRCHVEYPVPRKQSV